MVDADLSKVPEKKPKIAISLSLDKENVEFLKEDIEKHGKEITISGVFDYWLEQFVKTMKKKREEEKSTKKGENKKDD